MKTPHAKYLKIKLHSKVAALGMIAKYHNLFKRTLASQRDCPHCKKTGFPEHLVKWVPAMAIIALIVACDGGPPDLRSVYEEDNLHVGLLTIRGEEYSHPYVMSSIEMARVLGGLWCRNPNAVIPTFTDPQIERLAPHLAGALEQAADTDIITYYVTVPHTAGRRLITSGALYVTDGRLVVIVSNCRSEPHDARDLGFSPDIDTPAYPLVPVNLVEHVEVGFTPSEAVMPGERLSEPLVIQMRGYRRAAGGKQFVTIDLKRLLDAQDSAIPHQGPER